MIIYYYDIRLYITLRFDFVKHFLCYFHIPLSPLQGELLSVLWMGEVDELSSIFFFEFPILCFKLET